MAKSKSKTFRSDHDVEIVVTVPGHSTIRFTPGDVRTVTTEDPAVIKALSANPDVSEVKGK